MDKWNGSRWLCECDCGNTKIVSRAGLMSGDTKSCGCKKREDLTGRRFGRLIVSSYDHTDSNGYAYWRCLCDCGNEITTRGKSLRDGVTSSCGCRQREITRETNTTHGMTHSSLYRIWQSMKTRCLNAHSDDFYRYGGRGISICDEWLDFENFRDWALSNGYEEDLTIDRIDNNDGYYPENCRWADIITQCNNRRTSRYITYANTIHTVAEWARILGVKYSTLLRRIDHGDMTDFEGYFGFIDPDGGDI